MQAFYQLLTKTNAYSVYFFYFLIYIYYNNIFILYHKSPPLGNQARELKLYFILFIFKVHSSLISDGLFTTYYWGLLYPYVVYNHLKMIRKNYTANTKHFIKRKCMFDDS